MTEQVNLIPARLKSAVVGGHVAGADQIIDDNLGKTQNTINAETNSKFEQIDNEIEGFEKQDVVPVDTLPDVATADPKKIYRVVDETTYTDYMVNATGDGWKKIYEAEFPGIDDKPTAGSDNLVKSGGVYDAIPVIEDKDVNITGTLIDGYVRASSGHEGEIVTTQDQKRTDYIELSDGDSMTITAGGTSSVYKISAFNSSKQFVSNSPLNISYNPSGTPSQTIQLSVKNGTIKATVDSNEYSDSLANVSYIIVSSTVSVTLPNIVKHIKGILPNIDVLDELSENNDELYYKGHKVDTDVTVDVISNNIADKTEVQYGDGGGNGVIKNYVIGSSGAIGESNDYDIYRLHVTPGEKITVGGFQLSGNGGTRSLRAAWYNDSTLQSVETSTYEDPYIRRYPQTLTVPSGVNLLYFWIRTDRSAIPEGWTTPWDELQINKGETFLPYDEYKKVVTEIDGYPIGGGTGDVTHEEFEELEDRVTVLENTTGLPDVIADLPVSDGTDIETGYAYIDSTTGVVKVKMS